MMRTIPTIGAAVRVFAALSLSALRADAFVYHQCNGDASQWQHSLGVWKNTTSIPDNGSSTNYRNISLNNAINRIDSHSGITREVYVTGLTSDDSIDSNDGKSEVAVVPRDSIDGRNGRTWRIYSSQCGFSWDVQDLIEADVLVASDLNFENPASAAVMPGNFDTGYGRQVFMHEYGHAMGLEHANSFLSIMKSGAPKGLVGGPDTFVSIFNDDISGLRFLYPDTSITKIVISGQQHDGTDVADWESGSINITATRNVTLIPFPFSAQNQSISAKTINVWFMLVNDSNAYIIGAGSFALNSYNTLQASGFSFVAPGNVVPGTYGRITYLDPYPGSITEIEEDDNELIYNRQVVVQ